jgi:hypothetical protein
VPNLKKKYHFEILAASPGGAICGTMRINDGPVPELSDDPTALYPPLDSPFYDGMRHTGSGTISGFIDGATYTIISGGMRGDQLRFTVSGHEYLKGWCAQQTAYPNQVVARGYACLPPGNPPGGRADWSDYTCTMTINGTERVFEYAQCRFCTLMGGMSACACDSCHCTARVDALSSYDLTFNGDEAVGAPDSDGYQFRLKRVAP